MITTQYQQLRANHVLYIIFTAFKAISVFVSVCRSSYCKSVCYWTSLWSPAPLLQYLLKISHQFSFWNFFSYQYSCQTTTVIVFAGKIWWFYLLIVFLSFSSLTILFAIFPHYVFLFVKSCTISVWVRFHNYFPLLSLISNKINKIYTIRIEEHYAV